MGWALGSDEAEFEGALHSMKIIQLSSIVILFSVTSSLSFEKFTLRNIISIDEISR